MKVLCTTLRAFLGDKGLSHENENIVIKTRRYYSVCRNGNDTHVTNLILPTIPKLVNYHHP